MVDGNKIPIVNTIFRNLASVLPNVSSNKLVAILIMLHRCTSSVRSVDSRPISAVLSSQLSATRFSTSVPIQLIFDIDKV